MSENPKYYFTNSENALMNDDIEFGLLEQGEYLQHVTKGNITIGFFIIWYQDVFPTIMNYYIETEDHFVKQLATTTKSSDIWNCIVEYLATYSQEYKNYQARITALYDKYPIKKEWNETAQK